MEKFIIGETSQADVRDHLCINVYLCKILKVNCVVYFTKMQTTAIIYFWYWDSDIITLSLTLLMETRFRLANLFGNGLSKTDNLSSPACTWMHVHAHTLAIQYVNIYALPITGNVYNHEHLLQLWWLSQEYKISYKILH